MIAKVIILFGNISLVTGLLLSFMSNRIEIKIMEPHIRLGMKGKDAEDERVLDEKKKSIKSADIQYKLGIALTLFGILLSTIGTFLN